MNNVVIVSGAQQRDSTIHIHVSILPQTPLPSRLPHNIEQSSLCCTVGPCWLSILFYLFIYFKNQFIVSIFIYLFIYLLAVLGLCCCMRTFSSCGRVGATLCCGVRASHCGGFSCCRARASRHAGFSSCSMQAQQLWLAGSREQAQQLWRRGLVALRHVGSSRTRDRTRVPCIGRRILNHCTTREVSGYLIQQCVHVDPNSITIPSCILPPW